VDLEQLRTAMRNKFAAALLVRDDVFQASLDKFLSSAYHIHRVEDVSAAPPSNTLRFQLAVPAQTRSAFAAEHLEAALHHRLRITGLIFPDRTMSSPDRGNMISPNRRSTGRQETKVLRDFDDDFGEHRELRRHRRQVVDILSGIVKIRSQRESPARNFVQMLHNRAPVSRRCSASRANRRAARFIFARPR